MKVLVTGGAGFVGSHLVDALIAEGHQVRVLDSLDTQVHGENPSRPDHLHQDAEFRLGDVRDRKAVADALEGIEVVFHEAAAVGVGQSMYQMEHYVSVNAVGAAVLLEEVVARKDRIQKMVVASSMSIYGEGAYQTPDGTVVYPGLRDEADLAAQRFELFDANRQELTALPTPEEKPLVPTSIYAITKRDHEEMFLSVGAAYDIPAVALRYFNIYGPRQSLNNPYTGVMAIFSSRILNRHRPMIFEDGQQSRDFVHVSDIVQANLLAMQKDEANGKVFNVGTGRSTSVLRIADLLAEQLDFPESADVVGKFRAGDIRHCFANISRIEKELGYKPRVTLEDGMRDLLAWIRTQSADDKVEQAAKELEARGLTR